VTFTVWLFVLICLTVISFFVMVPVLSVQITVVVPRVSTEFSLLIMALLVAILWAPRLRVIMSTVGKPSGMAEMARLTAVMKDSTRVTPFR